MKMDGGAVRLTENANALRKVDGSEITCMVREFEDVTGILEKTESGCHHE